MSKVPGVGAELLDEDDLAQGLAEAERARTTARRLLEQAQQDVSPLLELAVSHARLLPGMTATRRRDGG